tara:strand:+ start:457 stop:933 length:477 start_codon:yes stop_codon:yes gene_type:complete
MIKRKKYTSQMIIAYFFVLLLLSCANTTNNENSNDINENILLALREKDRLGNDSRNLYTNFDNPEIFESIFPGTNLACGYILRYYFYTNIYLDQDSNKLFSMDGSLFNLNEVNFNSDKISEAVIIQTNEVMRVIGNMSIGSGELNYFLQKYPNAKYFD